MSDFPSHVKPLIADIPGWLTDEEGEALYELARTCRGDGVIVEIGRASCRERVYSNV